MKIAKIKKRPARVVVSIITLLLIMVAVVAATYGAGLISPLTKSLLFAMAFGAPPDALAILVSGGITALLPVIAALLISWAFYKAVKALYEAYS